VIHARRGLTLLEVVAAAALLAVIAAACLPMLREARRWAESTSEPHRFDDLAMFADAVLVRPESVGLTAEDLVKADLSIELDGGAFVPLLSTVTVRLVTTDAEEVRRAWLVFESGKDAVLRPVELPEEPRP